MPQTIAFLILPYLAPIIAGTGVSLGTLTGIVTAISYGIQATVVAGIAVGVNALSRALFAPQAPKPQDRQGLIRQAAQPRFRSYGRVKVGGVIAFLSVSDGGALYRLICTGQGEIDAIEEHWVDSNVVEPDGLGVVNDDPYLGKISLFWRLGTDDQMAYDEIVTAFPSLWTTDHRLRGIPNALIITNQVKAEKFGQVYPRGEPLYRQVQRAAKVYDWEVSGADPDDTATYVWSENAAKIIFDFLCHADGMRIPRAKLLLAMDLWQSAANICDEPIALKAGGTEKRWRIWGSYGFDERPVDVLGRFMRACDAILVETPNGGIGIKVGKWETPTVTLDRDSITGVESLTGGPSAFAGANVIRAQYLSPFHDYQAVDADPWTDEAAISARGEQPRNYEFHCAPSHGQCRRLMKLAMARANPRWSGTLMCNLRAAPVLGERFITVTLPELGIDGTFEVLGTQWVFGENMTVKGLAITVASIDASAYDWNAAAEEGTAPAIPDDLEISHSLPVPTGLAVVAQTKIVDGVTIGVVALITFDPPAEDFFSHEIRYKRTDLSIYQAIAIATDSLSAETGILDSGFTYEFQIRHVSVTGRVSEWSDPVELYVSSDLLGAGGADQLGAGGSDVLGAG